MSVTGPLQPVIQKLKRIGNLDAGDLAALAALPYKIVTLANATPLVRQGESTERCFALLKGHTYRWKWSKGGNSQILCFHMPGDLFDLRQLVDDQATANVTSLSAATIAEIPLSAVRELKVRSPRIADAFWRDTLIDAAIFEEWVFNIGQRDARARIAHLLAEFAARRAAALPEAPASFVLPMTQNHIAAATGITTIHTNRILKQLEADGAISRQGVRVVIENTTALRAISGFDPSYLGAMRSRARSVSAGQKSAAEVLRL